MVRLASLVVAASLPLVSAAHAATLTVTSSGEGSPGSLRNVLDGAAAGDTIVFSGVTEVTLALPLSPSVPVTIDGGGVVALDAGNSAHLVTNLSGLVLRGLTFTGGSAGYGGSISTSGSIEIEACTFVGNQADNGGAIGNSGTLVIRRSLFTGNQTTGNSGAAIINTGTLRIVNSTFSGNTVTGDDRVGGAIAQFGNTFWGPVPVPPSLAVSHSTFTGNVATGAGGAIYVDGGTAVIGNSIFSGNAGVGAPELAGTFTSEGYNVIADLVGATITVATGDQIGADPMLGALTDVSGGPRVHPITASSAAFDAGTCDEAGGGGVVAADQRGQARPVGAACDAGAFEFAPVRLTEQTELEPGEVCPAGGFRTDTGLDLNADGSLGLAEIDDTTFSCGTTGGDAGIGGGGDGDGGAGCCQTGDAGAPGVWLLAMLVAAGLGRRRRAPAPR